MFRNRERAWRQPGWSLLICWALLYVSCREEEPQAKRPIDFVPSAADVVALVDYPGFASSDILRKVFDISHVEQTLVRIGVSPDNILGIAGFARVNLPTATTAAPTSPEENRGDFAVIVQGKGGFQPVFKLLSEEQWLREEYEGRSFWAAPGEDIAAALVASDILAAGTPAAVRQVIDVAIGKDVGAGTPRSENDCGAILRRIGMGGHINIAISFSQEMRMAAKEVSQSAGVFGGMTGASLFGQLFDALGWGRGVGMSFKGTEEGIASRVVFVARDAATAKVIAGLVGVAKILVPRIGDFGRMEQAAEMVRGLNVASESNLVLIDFDVPESILTGAMR